MFRKKIRSYIVLIIPIEPFSDTLLATIEVGSSAQLLGVPKLRLIMSQPVYNNGLLMLHKYKFLSYLLHVR